MGILTLLALFLAFIFHGFGFAPDRWWNWQGMVLAGLVFLACAVMEIGFPFTVRRK